MDLNSLTNQNHWLTKLENDLTEKTTSENQQIVNVDSARKIILDVLFN